MSSGPLELIEGRFRAWCFDAGLQRCHLLPARAQDSSGDSAPTQPGAGALCLPVGPGPDRSPGPGPETASSLILLGFKAVLGIVCTKGCKCGLPASPSPSWQPANKWSREKQARPGMATVGADAQHGFQSIRSIHLRAWRHPSSHFRPVSKRHPRVLGLGG